MTKVLLDTNILIALERGKLTLEAATQPQDIDVAVSVMTLGELGYGVERADDAHREQRRRFLMRAIETFEVVDYTIPVALVHARLAAATAARGLTRSRPDLMIAAAAVHTGRVLITADRDFEPIADLKLRPVLL
ncbi:type II toxin-antitoxin system VapC family toxin [Fodinicola feengrottensis]|uniref:type II toxin-antitoxin system VapC family toxin n=1 Tax=Fodinicola feengrottensis TaxID=435914 RepID=UPI0031D3704D